MELSELRPFSDRYQAAIADRDRLARELAAADVELAAARQEFDDAVALLVATIPPVAASPEGATS